MEEKTFFNGQWKAVEKLGEGSFGIVYKAVKEQYGVESYSAIKQIMIPQTDEYFSKLKSQGMTQSDIEKSYDSQVKKWVEEIQFLNQFKDNENIVSIEDFEVLERKDKPGRTINIRMELLQNIDDHVMDRTITDKKVLKMASDILKALEECEEKNVVHRDIKPENVFVNSRGTYKLGDFGEAKSIEKTVSNMSKKGTENYMAPEIYKGERGSRSVDTYSLGIMLYKYFNNNRLPFIPDYPNSITFEDMESALEKRMSGKEMKPPVKASNNIARIILKACRYKPADRYKSAMEFRNDIEEELRAIINPIKLFDFQEGEIEKDNSISEFGKTVGIFEDDTNSKTSLDRTTGIFDDYSKNEEQNNKHIKKSREIIEKVNTENLKADDEIIIEKNKNIEDAYSKKQFEYQESKTNEIVHVSKNETKKEIKDVKYEEHFSGQIKYSVPNNYNNYIFIKDEITSNFSWACSKFSYNDFEITVGYNGWICRSENVGSWVYTKNKLQEIQDIEEKFDGTYSMWTYYKENKKEYIFIRNLAQKYHRCWYFKFSFYDNTIARNIISKFFDLIKIPEIKFADAKLEENLHEEEAKKATESTIISGIKIIDEITLYLSKITFFDASVLRGYNQHQVNKFIDEIYLEVEKLKNKNSTNYEEKVNEIKNKIKNKKFSKEFMGYPVKQVDEFLNKLIYKLDFSLKTFENINIEEKNKREKFGYDTEFTKPNSIKVNNLTKDNRIYEKHYCYGIEFVVPNNYNTYLIENTNIKTPGIEFSYDNMKITVKYWYFITKYGAKKNGLRRLEEFDGNLVNSMQEHLTINGYDIIKITYYKDDKKNYVFYFNPDSCVYVIRFITNDDSTEDVIWETVKSLKYEENLYKKLEMDRKERTKYDILGMMLDENKI